MNPLFTHRKAHPRYGECRLLSSDLGWRGQSISGSFNSCPLSRYCLPAGQLIVASGSVGLLSENYVQGH